MIVRAYFTVIAECGVAATLAVEASIARGAEVAIVTGGGVVDMRAISLFASIVRACVAIVAVYALADAIPLHTDIITGAEIAVVTSGRGWRMDASVFFVAAILGAWVVIIAADADTETISGLAGAVFRACIVIITRDAVLTGSVYA